MYTVLIVEDDINQLDGLGLIIKEYNGKFTILKAENSTQAIEYIDKYNIDIFILDVDLSRTSSNYTGILLGAYIRKIHKYSYSPMIFITSLPEKISDAINELHCYNYILKPYNSCDVIKSIDSIIHSPLIKDVVLKIKNLQGIGLKIKVSEICFIEANGRYIKIYTSRGIFQTTEYTLEELSSSMLLGPFIRCHRKYIVNLDFVTNYNKTNLMLACDKQIISVGRAFKGDFEKRYYDN